MAMLNSKYFEAVCESQALLSRPILGLELLGLQGMNFNRLPNVSGLHNFSHGEMSNLAGNAFCSCQLAVAFTIALTVLGRFLPDKWHVISLRQKKLQGEYAGHCQACVSHPTPEQLEEQGAQGSEGAAQEAGRLGSSLYICNLNKLLCL